MFLYVSAEHVTCDLKQIVIHQEHLNSMRSCTSAVDHKCQFWGSMSTSLSINKESQKIKPTKEAVSQNLIRQTGSADSV